MLVCASHIYRHACTCNAACVCVCVLRKSLCEFIIIMLLMLPLPQGEARCVRPAPALVCSHSSRSALCLVPLQTALLSVHQRQSHCFAESNRFEEEQNILLLLRATRGRCSSLIWRHDGGARLRLPPPQPQPEAIKASVCACGLQVPIGGGGGSLSLLCSA